MKILFYAIVGGLIGYLLGRLQRAIIDRLAERSEPKRDAPGKRDPKENPFEGFEPPIGICPSIHTYRRGHPENRFCCKCGAGEHHPIHDIPAHLKASSSDFEPPILSSMPLHEFKKCSNSPYCEECGAGMRHAVHTWATAQNRELWESIQRERAKL